ncbi:periplasmic binding protein-like I [Rhizoclosmatium globosum]|uniref:Periplasmic binding protein-like I n=1 Tax=Rhizoclosmatium globosum TaxID=329046 RepID=A0A1Y2CWS7_9FUNG|nr:periplasmic binding protein-like I [Rhizoclosmatium globosum]|eukprot:ORY51294.1 periplasmic binding protein-like I [Rhizoclosmatium globosum]
MSDDIVNIHTDVIAVIGSDISSVTIPTAEILSIYQIPYCSVCAASPALSNKDMFSYFWRPQLENFGQALAVFLLALNVKQIAVLYQPFSSYGYVSQEVVSEAQRHGIRIVAKLSLSQSPSVSLEEALFVTMSLNRVSARYIVMIGDSSKVSGILYRVGKLGIFGPNFVWLVYNEPTTSAPLIEYGPDYETYASNYICVGRTDVNLTATANQFYSYTQITKSDLSRVDLFQNSNVRLSADCVMNLLYGLDKLLKTNKSVTPDLLSSRKGNALLDYSRFQDTGYNGLAFHPFQLTETGDLKAPTIFASVSRKSSLDFGETNANSTLFTFYSPNLPVFFNRSTIRPSDGSKTEPILYSYSLETIDGQWILILCTLGITACILATLFLYVARETASVKAASVAESFTIILACLLCYLSLFGSFGVKTWAKCHFQWLGLSSGYNLGLSTILCKNLLLVRLFGRKHVKRPEREVLIFRVLNWGLVIIHFVKH